MDQQNTDELLLDWQERVGAARQRAEQYFTFTQWRAHFLRQSKGSPQWTHSFDGKLGFACMG